MSTIWSTLPDCECGPCIRSKQASRRAVSLLIGRLPLEVKTRIAFELQPSYATALARVNREWSQAATPVIWRSINIRDTSSDEDFARQFATMKILRHRPFRAMHTTTVSYNGSDGSAMPLLADLLEIIGTYLKALNFSSRNPDEPPSTFAYRGLRLNEMPKFIRMRRLDFTLDMDRNGGTLVDLLHLCPCLTDLRINISMDCPNQEEALGLDSWPTLPYLTNLELRLRHGDYDDLVSILDHCPELQNLEFDAEHFPAVVGQYLDRIAIRQHPTSLRRLVLPAQNRTSRSITSSLLKHLSSCTSMVELVLRTSHKDDFQQLIIPPNALKTIIVEDNLTSSDKRLPFTRDTMSCLCRFFTHQSSLYCILWPKDQRHDTTQTCIMWNAKRYDGIMLRSYDDQSTGDALYHYLYPESLLERTQDGLPEAFSSVKLKRVKLEPRKWISEAFYNDVPVPQHILKQIYDIMGIRIIWEAPGRGFTLSNRAWEALRLLSGSRQ